MPDWQELVRQRLSGLKLDAAEREEVQTELAAHLGESYERFCKQGLVEKEAVSRTLEQVLDWQELQRQILAAKRREYPMKERTKQLWIPGFLILILSMILLVLLQKAGLWPRLVGRGSTEVLFYGPWLASLPFFGALAAYISSRAGGSRPTVLLASVFPVLALTTAFLLMFPIGLMLELLTGKRFDDFFSIATTALLKEEISWLVLPGAAFLVGGWVVHALFRRSSESHHAMVG